MSALAIAIAIPLTIRSANQQTETRSQAAEPAVQTQTNAQGTVTLTSGVNLAELSSPSQTAEKRYALTVTYGNGNSCRYSSFSYRVNGLKFTQEGKDPQANFCMALFNSISSTSNCNTFSLIAPSGFHNVGIGYKRSDKGMETFRFENVNSKTLCNYNYLVQFAIERD